MYICTHTHKILKCIQYKYIHYKHIYTVVIFNNIKYTFLLHLILNILFKKSCPWVGADSLVGSTPSYSANVLWSSRVQYPDSRIFPDLAPSFSPTSHSVSSDLSYHNKSKKKPTKIFKKNWVEKQERFCCGFLQNWKNKTNKESEITLNLNWVHSSWKVKILLGLANSISSHIHKFN